MQIQFASREPEKLRVFDMHWAEDGGVKIVLHQINLEVFVLNVVMGIFQTLLWRFQVSDSEHILNRESRAFQ